MLFGALYIGLRRSNESHYRPYFPAEFHDFKFVNYYDSFRFQDIPTLLIPMRHESTGCAIFEVTPQWINKIKKDGISALQELTASRNQRLVYQWKETPRSWGSTENLSGAWGGLDQAPQNIQYAVMRKMREPGSFVGGQAGRFVVVIPSLQWAIYTY